MAAYISLLRGINVSGQKKIKMDELKKLYDSLGFKKVQTYIQSGNVVFECPDASIPKIAERIGKKIKESFGFDVAVLIRTKEEFKKIIRNNPFSKKENNSLYVIFLSDTASDLPMAELNNAKSKSEEFFISGREIYLSCPGGYGKTKLSNNFFERKLKLSATTRNWKTVNKLMEIAG